MKEMTLHLVWGLEPRPSDGSLGYLMLGVKGGASPNLWVFSSKAPTDCPMEGQLCPAL